MTKKYLIITFPEGQELEIEAEERPIESEGFSQGFNTVFRSVPSGYFIKRPRDATSGDATIAENEKYAYEQLKKKDIKAGRHYVGTGRAVSGTDSTLEVLVTEDLGNASLKHQLYGDHKPGRDKDGWLQCDRSDFQEALSIYRAILDKLEPLHSQAEMVHSDLDLTNIIYHSTTDVDLIDPGISKRIGQSVEKLYKRIIVRKDTSGNAKYAKTIIKYNLDHCPPEIEFLAVGENEDKIVGHGNQDIYVATDILCLLVTGHQIGYWFKKAGLDLRELRRLKEANDFEKLEQLELALKNAKIDYETLKKELYGAITAGREPFPEHVPGYQKLVELIVKGCHFNPNPPSKRQDDGSVILEQTDRYQDCLSAHNAAQDISIPQKVTINYEEIDDSLIPSEDQLIPPPNLEPLLQPTREIKIERLDIPEFVFVSPEIDLTPLEYNLEMVRLSPPSASGNSGSAVQLEEMIAPAAGVAVGQDTEKQETRDEEQVSPPTDSPVQYCQRLYEEMASIVEEVIRSEREKKAQAKS